MRTCRPSSLWIAIIITVVLFVGKQSVVLESTILYLSNGDTKNPMVDDDKAEEDGTKNKTGAVNRQGMTMLAPGIWIHSDWHPKLRSERFPNVAQRVKLYMSNWYHPPCGLNSTKLSQYILGQRPFSMDTAKLNIKWPLLTMINPWNPHSGSNETFDSIVTPDTKFLVNRHILHDCARELERYLSEGELVVSESRIENRRNMQSYCKDSIDLVDILDHVDNRTGSPASTPILAMFGDNPAVLGRDKFDVPVFGKFRATTSQDNLDQVTLKVPPSTDSSLACQTIRKPLITTYHQDIYHNRFSPILWKLESQRHWDPLPDALRVDTAWENKKNRAFWAGVMTGVHLKSPPNQEDCLKNDTCRLELDLKRCQANQRCNFVMNHANSTLIDCGLTSVGKNRLSRDSVNGINLIKDFASMEEVQTYKVIVSLEGNDVASGLKWALQSQSVVLMPPPTQTSWAMEELLEPWVHYIPMYPNGSNAEEMVQWALDNDDEARRIAERATLFIYDLLYHPEAKKDELKVKKNIVRRYRALWH